MSVTQISAGVVVRSLPLAPDGWIYWQAIDGSWWGFPHTFDAVRRYGWGRPTCLLSRCRRFLDGERLVLG